MSKIKMEDEVKDKITGFTGKVTARVEYMNGCVQFEVTGELLEGKMQKPVWMDEQRLEIVEEEKEEPYVTPDYLKPVARTRHGGPQGTPTGMNTPPDSQENNDDAGYGMMT